MAVASPDDYEPDLPPEPNAMYHVKVSGDPVGVALVSGGGKYRSGTEIWINASSNDPNYEFSHWTMDGNQSSTESGFYYTVGTKDVNFVAHFRFVEVPEEEYEPELPEEPHHQDPVIVVPTYPLILKCDPSDGGSFNRTSGEIVERDATIYCEVYLNQDFSFLGWFDANGELVSQETGFYYTMPDASVTLTARMEYNPVLPADPTTEQPTVDNNSTQKYLIQVVSAGYGTVSCSHSDSVLVGTSITLSATPDAHYVFSHWSDGSSANPYTITASRDETITAYFDTEPHTLTYIVDGEVYQTMYVLYGSDIVTIDEPTKEGYTFSGWSDIPATMPDEDVIVTGFFSVNSYTLTYMVEGVEYKSVSLEYGTTIIPEPEPTSEGLNFAGWSGWPEDMKMPAHDVVISGNFEASAVFTDGTVYDKSEDEFVRNLTYVRSFSNTDWQALYIPFSLSVEALEEYGLVLAELNNMHMYDRDDDGEFEEINLEFLRMTKGETEPNCPYLIKATSVGEREIKLSDVEMKAAEEASVSCATIKQTFTFTGTYTGLSNGEMYANNYYALGGGNLSRASSASVSLKPQRWYMSISNKNGTPVAYYAPSFRIYVSGWEEEENVTGVSAIESQASAECLVYSMDGRKLQGDGSLRPGVYVSDGRKFIIR